MCPSRVVKLESTSKLRKVLLWTSFVSYPLSLLLVFATKVAEFAKKEI